MTQLNELYRCNICGNVVEVTNEGAPALVCCEQPMDKLDAKTIDEGKEKHVPVVEETSNGVKVTVGSVAHPMDDDHYIKFIEIITSKGVCRAELKPGGAPEAVLCADKGDIVEVREFCTKHMLWKG